MNSFDVQLTCPACGSSQVEVYRQPGSKFTNFGSIPVMSCRDCRKRLRGDDVPAEAIALLKFGGFSAPRREPPKPAPSANRQVERPAPPPVAKVAPPPVVKAPVVEAPKPAPAKAIVSVSAVEHAHGMCDWKDCDQPARKGSKYCSRGCSNKNARWRYSQKKSDEE